MCTSSCAVTDSYLLLAVLHTALQLQDLLASLSVGVQQFLGLGLQLCSQPLDLLLQQLLLLLHALLSVLQEIVRPLSSHQDSQREKMPLQQRRFVSQSLFNLNMQSFISCLNEAVSASFKTGRLRGSSGVMHINKTGGSMTPGEYLHRCCRRLDFVQF